jgi:hypothetical protein
MDLQTEQRLLDDLRAIDQETLTGFSKSIDDFRASDQEVVHRLTCSNMANLCTLPAAAPASKGEDKRDAVQKMLVSICQKLTKIEQFQKSMQLSMERSQQQVLQKVDAVVERVQQSRESHMDLSFEHGNDTQSRLNDSDPNLHSHHCTRDLQSSIFAVPEVAGHKRKKRVSRAKSPMGYPAPEAGAEPQTAAFGHDLEPQSLASPATVTNLDSMTESTEDYEERQMKWWQVGVILPDCKFKQGWNVAWLLLSFAEFWYITLTMVTYDQPFGQIATHPALIFYLLTTCFFIVDMYIQSKTAYRAEYSICDDDEKEVRWQYLRGWFWADLVITLPWGVVLLPFSPIPFGISRCLRIFRPLRALKLWVWSNSLEKMPGYMAVQRMLYFTCIFTHSLVVGSIVFFKHFEIGGMIQKETVAQHLWNSWVISFYWVCTCLSTVGFGDIFPTNNTTRLYSLLVMVFSIYMNVYLLSAGLSPALQNCVLKEKMEQKKARLAAVLKFYKVPWALQKQVFTVYPFCLEAGLHDMQEVSELPEYIQDKIYNHIKVSLLGTVPLLQKASPKCRNVMATKMQRVVASPSQYLMKEGEDGDCMFFLVKGMVEVLGKDADGREKLHCTLKEGSWFGEVALIEDIVRTASVRTITVCSLFRLDKESFHKVFFAPSLKALPRLFFDCPIAKCWSSLGVQAPVHGLCIIYASSVQH